MTTQDQRYDILLAEQDEAFAELIVQHVEASLDARVTCVRTIRQTLQTCAGRSPDVIVADMQLPDGDGLTLARELGASSEGPGAVILLADRPTLGRAVEAMRLGVRDLFTKPFDLHRLSHVIEQEAQSRRRRRRQETRNARLRKLTRQVIRDRRDLRRRVDLVCRDLVYAYRQLAKKVVEQHIGDDSDE